MEQVTTLSWSAAEFPPGPQDCPDGLVWLYRRSGAPDGHMLVSLGRWDRYTRRWHTWRGNQLPEGSVTHWQPAHTPHKPTGMCDRRRTTSCGSYVCDLPEHGDDRQCHWLLVTAIVAGGESS